MSTTILAREARLDVYTSSSMVLQYASLTGPKPDAERLAAALNMDDLKGVSERCDTLERKFDCTDGSSVLVTWVSTTSQDYFEQCWFKFGGVEICKTRFEMGMSKQDAWKNRDFIILGDSAVAEFVTDAFLGTRSWLPRTMWLTVCTMISARCSGNHHTPLVKISVQQKMAETTYQNLGTAPSEMNNDALLMLSLVQDIVTDVVSLAECPDSEFNLEPCLKDQKRMRSNTILYSPETMKKQTSWMPFFLLPARPVPGP